MLQCHTIIFQWHFQQHHDLNIAPVLQKRPFTCNERVDKRHFLKQRCGSHSLACSIACNYRHQLQMQLMFFFFFFINKQHLFFLLIKCFYLVSVINPLVLMKEFCLLTLWTQLNYNKKKKTTFKGLRKLPRNKSIYQLFWSDHGM